MRKEPNQENHCSWLYRAGPGLKCNRIYDGDFSAESSALLLSDATGAWSRPKRDCLHTCKQRICKQSYCWRQSLHVYQLLHYLQNRRTCYTCIANQSHVSTPVLSQDMACCSLRSRPRRTFTNQARRIYKQLPQYC